MQSTIIDAILLKYCFFKSYMKTLQIEKKIVNEKKKDCVCDEKSCYVRFAISKKSIKHLKKTKNIQI